MFLISDKRFRDDNLTNAGNKGLQVTPYRNYGSGLPKEAHIDISNFRANRKRAVLGNFSEYCLFFEHPMIRKCTLRVAINRQ